MSEFFGSLKRYTRYLEFTLSSAFTQGGNKPQLIDSKPQICSLFNISAYNSCPWGSYTSKFGEWGVGTRGSEKKNPKIVEHTLKICNITSVVDHRKLWTSSGRQLVALSWKVMMKSQSLSVERSRNILADFFHLYSPSFSRLRFIYDKNPWLT